MSVDRRDNLRIAQIAPFWFDVPPKNFGGTERVVSLVTEELVRRGHEVTLFATEGSRTAAKLVSPVPPHYIDQIRHYADLVFLDANTMGCREAFQRAGDFDIVHSHAFFSAFPFSGNARTPVVHTLQNIAGSYNPELRQLFDDSYRQYPNLNFISVSNNFRLHTPPINYVATVYNGTEVSRFPFREDGGEELVWIGALRKEKGELEAIRLAREMGLPLVMAAATLTPTKEEYFQNVLIPQLNGSITVIKNKATEEQSAILGRGKAFLFPMQWEEPFGLVMIEAMAMGLPVITYAKGSAPEVVRDGVTGFLVNPCEDDIRGNWQIQEVGYPGLLQAVERLYQMPDQDYRQMRQAARRHVEDNFSVGRMVDGYEKVYRSFLD